MLKVHVTAGHQHKSVMIGFIQITVSLCNKRLQVTPVAKTCILNGDMSSKYKEQEPEQLTNIRSGFLIVRANSLRLLVEIVS